jgi:DNA modification methylase
MDKSKEFLMDLVAVYRKHGMSLAHEDSQVNTLDQCIQDRFAIYNGDCCEVLKGVPSNSVHYSIFSPPFASLYTYSNSPRDLGNVKNDKEFFDHFAFAIKELFRVLKPGRLLSMHCMLMPTSKERDGYIGLRDFRGDLIRAFQAEGFIFHSEVVIWKDPVTAMQRTKALGLLHKTIRKDSSMSRQGIPDYLVTMRKPGVNDEPIAHTHDEFPVSLWQRYASPVWMDINPSDTLQHRSARENDDERHICLAEGSLVLTREHGYLPIEMVEPGERVLTHRGRWMPVLAKRCNGNAETVSVSAQGVANLVLTPDHKIYVRQASGAYAKKSAMETSPDWVNASETLGSYVNMQLPPVEDSVLTEDEWWIIGRWLGDGHRGTRQTSGARGAGFGEFIISCAHSEAAELAEKLGPYAGHRSERTATQITLRGLRHEVRETLDRCGHGAANKHLPGEATTLSREKSEALLSGYLSADGHYVEKYDRHCASSISRSLLLGMSMVAMRARGVVASVYAGRPDRDGEICGRAVHMRQDWVFSFRGSDGYRKSGWIDEHGSWKKVRKIETSGVRQVWDLQVEGDESFTAEGCVVHNCPLQLQVIRRALKLWTNPGDVVLSPFAGIGSEGYVSLEEGRKFVGVELKRSYYEQATRNLTSAQNVKQQDLFASAE